jgi:DNA-binding LacI/PurR family transcriptional regulator
VPEEFSVVGFDDLPDSLVVDPILTVAAQPAYEMGRQAADLLVKRITEKLSSDPQEIILPTEIVLRRSSAAPRIHA